MAVEDDVLAASQILGEVETLLKQAKAKARELKAPLKSISDQSGASVAETMSVSLRAEAICLQAEAAMWELHLLANNIAKERGIDLIGTLGGTR